MFSTLNWWYPREKLRDLPLRLIYEVQLWIVVWAGRCEAEGGEGGGAVCSKPVSM